MSFWIGDKVYLKKSGRSGIVSQTLTDGKIKVKVDDTIIITKASNLELIPENDFEFPDWVFANENIQEKKTMAIENTIDLHIEKLQPAMIHASPSVILPYQVKQCKIFIEKNIHLKKSHVFVICGKGEGILKHEIIHLLKHEFNVRFIFEKNEGGMLEIWL